MRITFSGKIELEGYEQFTSITLVEKTFKEKGKISFYNEVKKYADRYEKSKIKGEFSEDDYFTLYFLGMFETSEGTDVEFINPIIPKPWDDIPKIEFTPNNKY